MVREYEFSANGNAVFAAGRILNFSIDETPIYQPAALQLNNENSLLCASAILDDEELTKAENMNAQLAVLLDAIATDSRLEHLDYPVFAKTVILAAALCEITVAYGEDEIVPYRMMTKQLIARLTRLLGRLVMLEEAGLQAQRD